MGSPVVHSNSSPFPSGWGQAHPEPAEEVAALGMSNWSRGEDLPVVR